MTAQHQTICTTSFAPHADTMEALQFATQADEDPDEDVLKFALASSTGVASPDGTNWRRT